MKRVRPPASVLVGLIFLLSSCSQPLAPAERSLDLAAQWGSGTLDVPTGTATYRDGPYVVGYTYGSVHSGNKGESDAVVRKVNRRGDLLWGRQFGTSAKDEAADVATDVQDNVYVLGQTYGSLAQPVRGQTDLFLRKYSASGQNVWTRQFGLEIDDVPWDLEATGNSVYALGLNNEVGSALYRFNKESGGTWWKKSFADIIFEFTVDGGGNLYVVGETLVACDVEGGLCAYAVVSKLNPFGKVVWKKRMRFGGPEEAARNFRFMDITLHGGSLYLTGDAFDTPTGEIPAYLVKLDASGASKWERRIGYREGAGTGYGYRFSTSFGLSADRTGVYVRAVTQYDGSTNIVYSYAKYGTDGAPRWKVGSDGYKSGSFIAGSLNAVDAGADNTLYLAGWVNGGRGNGPFLKRVNPSTGAVIWSR